MGRLHLMIPYFGYSTMERAAKDGEVVMAKQMAMLLSAVPPAPLGTRHCCSISTPKAFHTILKAT